MSAATPAPLHPDSLWAPARRQLVVGLLLTVTLVAFEAMAIAAIMPDVKDDLGGLGLYGWVFSGFFLTSLLGIVVAGQLADSRGLLVPYAAGLAMFAGGLVVGGLAGSMPVLVVGRIMQGFGAGAIVPTAYAAIARGIPGPLRPRMFAVLSSAWVVPGLVGPSAALGVEHALSWRWVFLALVPLVAVAGLLTAPALGPLGAGGDGDAPTEPRRAARRGERRQQVWRAVALVLGLGAVFAAASGLPPVLAVACAAVGLPVAVRSVRRLLPPGTFRLVEGVPATVAARGLLTFAFFAADAYVPLAVVDGRGGSSWVAGAALTVSALAWASGSWIQARAIDALGPRRLDRLGCALVAGGVVALFLVALGAPVPLVVVAWAVAGLGMGLAYAPQAVTVLALAAPGEEGAASAAIQLSDALGTALGTGLAGALIALGDGRGWAVSTSTAGVFVLALSGAVVGLLVARRLPAVVPYQPALV